MRTLINIIDHVGRQGQYINIEEAAIDILTLASIISNNFDNTEANHQYSDNRILLPNRNTEKTVLNV